MKPNLVLIYNNGVAVRYVKGKPTGEKAQLDFSVNIRQIRSDIEDFRQYGFPDDTKELA